jgi:hypothetical protein
MTHWPPTLAGKATKSCRIIVTVKPSYNKSRLVPNICNSSYSPVTQVIAQPRMSKSTVSDATCNVTVKSIAAKLR